MKDVAHPSETPASIPAMTNPTTIQVSLSLLRRGNYMQNYYECVGPDGTKFTNSSKATLKSVLTRRYGKVELVVTRLLEVRK